MRTVLCLAVLALATAASAQDPSTSGLENAPRPVSPAASASPPRSDVSYDIGLTLSDRLINLVLGKVIERKLARTGADKRRLTALKVTFSGREVTLAGSFTSPPTAATAGANFEFHVRGSFALPQSNRVLFTILAARVMLNGVRAFDAGPENASAIGAWLDFLSPSITRTASRAALAAETALSRSMGGPPEFTEVTDLLVIDGNKIILTILPTLLSPLFPPLVITSVVIDGGRIALRGNFK
jgi:hypothetical protein